jgi:plasmid stability protein
MIAVAIHERVIGETTMSNFLIRGLSVETVKQLKAAAKRHGRSLEAEVRFLLERAAGPGSAEKKKRAGRSAAPHNPLVKSS